MKKIFKYVIEPGPNEIDVPLGAEVLTVQGQGGHFAVWLRVSEDQPKRTRGFYLAMTGEDLDRCGNCAGRGVRLPPARGAVVKTKLSDAQFVALLWAVKHGDGRLHRWPGGFWTIAGMNIRERPSAGYAVPHEWYTCTQTVVALESKRFVKRLDAGVGSSYWAASREVTKEGRAALDAAIDSGQRSRITGNLKLWNLHDALRAEAEWRALA